MFKKGDIVRFERSGHPWNWKTFTYYGPFEANTDISFVIESNRYGKRKLSCHTKYLTKV